MFYPEKTIEFTGIPSYPEINEKGYGSYLKEVK
jgi:hypothetical protein